MRPALMEIRFHGRGGQGAVLASEILAHAAFREGFHVQSFPFFGVERRGAPVTAHTRIDDRPIGIRWDRYEPDLFVVLDASLLRVLDVAQVLRAGGTVVVNMERGPGALGLSRGRGATVAATAIALRPGLGARPAPGVDT